MADATQARTGVTRRWLARWSAMLLCSALFWPVWCDRGSRACYRGEPDAWLPLARHVAAEALSGPTERVFNTPSPLYESEWQFGTYQLSALGLGQVAWRWPDQRAALLPAIKRCLEALTSPALRRSHAQAWGVDPLDSLDGDTGQVGYLGYLSLALGMYRLLEPDNEFNALHDRLIAALARRLAAAPTGLIETYPGQSFPVDNAAAIGGLGLYDRVTGADHGTLIRAWVTTCRARYIDPRSGLFYQQVNARNGTPVDEARASGTALGLYFVSFADLCFARECYAALRRRCLRRPLGLGGMREYPRLVLLGGNVDSGPVVLGFGLTATGFGLAGARLAGDESGYRALYRTMNLTGCPLNRRGQREYVAGGAIGSALLLAMFTADAELGREAR
ncbi:MAG: hypothetical protein HZB16_18575 [Armatimonadetes bacterium]|nr:hypothetical protein [Armatimonadota bacterium]